MRRRFFVRAEDVGPETLRLTGDEAAHLRHVLRLSPGAQIVAFDGAGHEYEAIVSRIDADAVHCLIRCQRDAQAPPAVRIALGQGIPKAHKLEWVIQKTVELGVAEIVPLQSARVLPQPVERAAASKHTRWERIAREACKQSGRSTVPRLWPVTPLEEFFAAFRMDDLKLVLWEAERTRGLRGVLEADARVATASVAVGPEGGFAREEIECGEAYGFLPVSLGARILRTETAGLVMVSLLQYRFGDLG